MRARGIIVSLLAAAAGVGLIAACVGDDPKPVSVIVVEAGVDGAGPGVDGQAGPPPPPAVDCPAECLPAAPEGWRGPSAVMDDREPVEGVCPAPFPAFETKQYELSNLGPHTCSCGKRDPFGPGCRVEYGLASNAACTVPSGAPRTHLESAPRCSPIDNEADAGAIYITDVKLEGLCINGSDELSPRLGIHVKTSCTIPACAAKAECRARVDPLPSPYERVCVSQAGEQTCPTAYPHRFLTYGGWNDGRKCSPCVAELVGTCEKKIAGHVGPGCAGLPAGTYTPPCAPLGEQIGSLRFGEPSGVACVLDGGVPSGTVEPRDPVTICCDR